MAAEHHEVVRREEKERVCYDFRLTVKDNPLLEYVELPGHLKELKYQNIVAGAILGCF